MKRSTNFVSVQADATFDMSVKAQLSIFMQYVNELNIESYLGFFEVFANKPAGLRIS